MHAIQGAAQEVESARAAIVCSSRACTGSHSESLPVGGLIDQLRQSIGSASGEDVYTDGTYRGERILAPELVAAMTTDQLTPGQRDGAGPILDGRGWGFGLSIIDPPEPAGLKGYGWNGGFGTAWANDPGEDLVAILCTQVLAAPGSAAVEADFWRATYRAVAH